MNPTIISTRASCCIRALVAATITLLLLVAGVLVAPPANAATSTVTGGTLSWGIDAQYLSVFKTRANTTPATWTNGKTVASFPLSAANSSYDKAAGTGTLAYSGVVRAGYFVGPPKPGVTNGNYIYLKNPTIVVNGTTGSLIAGQVAGSSHSLLEDLPTHSGGAVTIATLDLSTAPTVTATSVTWASVPTAITAEGVSYLAQYSSPDDLMPTVRTAGSPLAPISFTITTDASVAAPVAAAVHVSKTADLDPAGEIVTVTGSGFLPNVPNTNGTRPPLTGKFGGAYLQFGYYDGAIWKGVSQSDTNLTKWALGSQQVSIAGSAGVTIADGAFTATLTPIFVKTAPEGARYGIRTYSGSGSTYEPFATFTEITFAKETSKPAIEVFLADGVTPVGNTVVPDGDTLIVKGTGFDPDVNVGGSGVPVPSSLPQGTFVVFGSFANDWRPSKGNGSATRATHKDARTWSLAENVLDQVPEPFQSTIRKAWVPIEDDGSFVAKVMAVPPAEPLTDGNWGVYTYAAGVGTPPNASQELAVAIHFAADNAGKEPKKPVTLSASVGKPATSSTPVLGGSLRWAISSSFSHYVTGPIATGSIVVSGGATRAGGQFQFGQSSGSTYNPATGLGVTSYSGSVRFIGHGGVLDVTLSNPQVHITSAGKAMLSVTSGGSQVAFAALDLASAGKAVKNGAVTYTAASARLTSAARQRVFQGNATTLDPVTFTIGHASAAPSGARGTVVRASLSGDKGKVSETPPVTTGIDLSDEDREALESGGQGSVSGSGFEPNEEGIAVVVYSTPVILSTVVADADGVANWTGSLPTSLENGEHTLTLQGSVERGVVLNFNRANVPLAEGACLAKGAAMSWGFKASFLNYIEGIAQGGWDLTDVEYTYPEFVWAGGSGSVDTNAGTGLVTYGGSIAFHGHNGALDTTLANIRLELTGDTGYVVLDIAGTKQGGEKVDERGVRFAEFALAGLKVTEGSVILDEIPVRLTAAGAAAFGTYSAGEKLDPVSAKIPVGTDCGTAVKAAVPPVKSMGVHHQLGVPVWLWALCGGFVLLALAVTAGMIVSRRRSASIATAGATSDN